MVHPVRLVVNLLITVVVLNGCANSIKHEEAVELKWFDEASLQLQNVNGVIMQNHQPFTGTVFSIAQNKKDTIAVGSFLNGKEDGEWRKYFENGRLIERRSFTNGKKTGVFEAWWPDGKQRSLYHFENGEYEGSCKDWSAEGLLINDMNYAKGYESGSQKQYYENGKVKANYIMKDGRRYGLLGTKNCVNVSDSVFKK